MQELIRSLGALAEPPAEGHERLAALLELPEPPGPADHSELFLLQLHPYASVHLGDEGMLGGEARDRVAGFWRAIGESPPPEPDHLAVLLGLYATLMEAEAGEEDEARRLLWRQARQALLWEHLLSWVPPFLAAVEREGGGFHRAWAGLLRSALLSEAERLVPPDELPLGLREATELPDPRSGEPGRFLDAVLAPVRSGMIITRNDLARAAAALGLGLRLGERRYVLQALASQDPGATFRWLRDEALRWADVHLRYGDELGLVRSFWTGRARAAGDLFDTLASTVGGVTGPEAEGRGSMGATA